MTQHSAASRITRRTVVALLAGGAAACAARVSASPSVQTYTAGERGMAVNSHLITSDDEALLIDCQFLKEDAQAVADMVQRSGATLGLVFMTHAHPDHVFGAAVLRERFPQARFVAHPEVAAAIRTMAPIGMGFMRPEFGDEIPSDVVLPEPWSDPMLTVGTRRLDIREVRVAEAELQTVVVEEGGELFAGDLLYSGTHLYLGDRAYAGWRAALDELGRFNAPHARPGHGAPAATSRLIAENRRYIDDYERVVVSAADAVAAEAALRSLYPRHRGHRLMRLSLATAFPATR